MASGYGTVFPRILNALVVFLGNWPPVLATASVHPLGAKNISDIMTPVKMTLVIGTQRMEGAKKRIFAINGAANGAAKSKF